MSPQVAHIFRHPIKAVGVEPLEAIDLEIGCTMPGDRVWAIAHEAARIASGSAAWQSCTNFCRGAKFPQLMAVHAATNGASGRVRLTHFSRPSLDIDPDDPDDAVELVKWARPLMDPDRAQPTAVYRADRGLTDSDFASISILNLASLAALSSGMDQSLHPARFRGNLWIDGLEPWAEVDLVGREIGIGSARLRVREPITRCKAICANPETGLRDADTLAALNSGWGHQNFGVNAEVIVAGQVAVGDQVALP